LTDGTKGPTSVPYRRITTIGDGLQERLSAIPAEASPIDASEKREQSRARLGDDHDKTELVWNSSYHRYFILTG
jgi:hypothetical protein